MATRRAWVDPVYTGDAADPFVLDTGDGYVAYTTSNAAGNVPILHSDDLSTWEAAGDALPTLGAWVDRSNPRVWAPSVLRAPSGFVLYYTANDAQSHRQCIGRAVSAVADGPFVDDAARPLVCQVDLGGSIDPSPFIDTDGHAYLLWKSDGNCCAMVPALWSQRLAADGLSLEGAGPSLLLAAEERWEKGIVEAPSLVRAGASYVLFYSGGPFASEAYTESTATCAGPMGPCTRAPLPFLGQTPGWAGPGGAEVVHGRGGALYLAFHAWPADRVGYWSGAVRGLHILELTFNATTPPVLHALGGGDPGLLRSPRVVSVAPLAAGGGAFTLRDDGSVSAMGSVTTHGDLTGVRFAGRLVGITPTPSGLGYWVYASDGGVFAFGDAPFAGSTGGMRLNRPVVGMAATASGLGYWLVAGDGGVFAFGDAAFAGSTGGMRLNRPIVAVAPTGAGYWMVASDGGVFAFGDAPFAGSLGGRGLDSIVGMTPTATHAGYWLTTETGGLYAFGDAPPMA
jgi:hypothetical protein